MYKTLVNSTNNYYNISNKKAISLLSVNHLKYPGIIIDNKLKWTPHINTLNNTFR